MASQHRSPGLGVPAYFGPWDRANWSALLAARPTVVIINPDSGPGRRRHGGYRPLVRALQAGGTRVLGYVSTRWLSVAPEVSCGAAQRHVDWYGVDGVLWDEIPVEPTSLRRIRPLATWASSQTLAQAFNPGRVVPTSWHRVAPEAWWITFEGTGRTYLERFPIEKRSNDWHLVHSVTNRQLRSVDALVRHYGPALAFVTADCLPNPWDTFPGQAAPPR